MRFHRLIAAGAFGAAIMTCGSTGAFEMTQIGGKNSSAHYQDPDEQQLMEPLGSAQYQEGSGAAQNLQNQGFQWSMQQSPGALGPSSGFNEPLLRDRR
jgi:hypothetical protein